MTLVSASTQANALLESCQIRRRLLKGGRPAFQLIDDSGISVYSSCKYIQGHYGPIFIYGAMGPSSDTYILPCRTLTDRVAPHPFPIPQCQAVRAMPSRLTAGTKLSYLIGTHTVTLRDRALHTSPFLAGVIIHIHLFDLVKVFLRCKRTVHIDDPAEP